MKEFEKETRSIIKALDDSKLLDKCLIAGSWAMLFYENLFKKFEAPIATTDFDIFFPKASKLKKSDISKALIDLNYLRDDDYLSGKTKYYSKTGFEIEFLTLPDRTMNSVIRIPALNIGAEALPKLELLLWNYIEVSYEGFNVCVPSPVSFCLQKLLINNERKEEKRGKDINSVKYLLSFINGSRKYIDEFQNSFEKVPRKWKKQILETIKQYNLITPLDIKK